MQTATVKRNIAPSSDNGHYVEGKNVQVIDLDATNETFVVNGKSTLTTKNHTSLDMAETCIVTCQQVYDPLKGAFEKSSD
jgi:hypothetical protein